jgi:hypothetical protein
LQLVLELYLDLKADIKLARSDPENTELLAYLKCKASSFHNKVNLTRNYILNAHFNILIAEKQQLNTTQKDTEMTEEII